MTILKDLSVAWALPFTLVFFTVFFESRYSRKKTLLLILYTMVPLLAGNFLLYLVFDTLAYSMMLFTCVLPSLVFFFFLARHRDGRFFFSFCVSDSIWLELMYISNILDALFGGQYIFMLVFRLLAYPLTALLLYKIVRPTYLEVQHSVEKGWYTFSAISALFYVMMLLSMSHPTMIMERPEYLPAFVLQLVLMPVVYIHIFITLRNQKDFYEMAEKEHVLQVQMKGMESRLEEYSAANEDFREARHDFRHKLRTLAGLAEKGQYDQLRATAREYADSMPELTVESYCSHMVLDAVLSSYLHWAKRRGIAVSVKLNLPDSLPVSESELATVLANALENAIHACEKLAPDQRHLEVKAIVEPCFMLQVRNSFDGVISFDANGIPRSHRKGHGFGTRSIVAFCEKNGAYCEFKAEDREFFLRIVFQ